jgi:hypothetical protein
LPNELGVLRSPDHFHGISAEVLDRKPGILHLHPAIIGNVACSLAQRFRFFVAPVVSVFGNWALSDIVDLAGLFTAHAQL